MPNIYLNELDGIAADDVAALRHAEKSYGDSWKKRGGIGAFMMLARKWDRLEKRVSDPPEDPCFHGATEFSPYDIFGAVATDKRAEGTIDDIRDLRRYLMLVEAELRATGRCPGKLAKDIEAGCASIGSTAGSGKSYTAGDTHHPLCDCPRCLEDDGEAPKPAMTPLAHMKLALDDMEAEPRLGAQAVRELLGKFRYSVASQVTEGDAQAVLGAALGAMEMLREDDTPPASVLHPG